MSVGCASEHTAVVDSNGSLWTFGRGWLGHDGRPSLAQVTPRRVIAALEPTAAAAAAAAGAGAAAEADDTVAAAAAAAGGTGLHPEEQQGQAEHVEEDFPPAPAVVAPPPAAAAAAVLPHYVEVSCGGAHTAVLSDSGALYTFGLGTVGQLGHYPRMYSRREPHGEAEPTPRRVDMNTTAFDDSSNSSDGGVGSGGGSGGVGR
eukprot:COSAG06_NODE_4133_length_4538_cov_25.938107_1_plen_202_part_10